VEFQRKWKTKNWVFDEVQFYQVFWSHGSIGIFLCEWNIPFALDIIFPALKLLSFETKVSWDFKEKNGAKQKSVKSPCL